MSRTSLAVASLLVVAMASGYGAPVALADTSVTFTAVSLPASLLPGQEVTYSVTVSPADATGSMFFETTTDDWATSSIFASGFVLWNAPGIWTSQNQTAPAAEMTRQIRAHFQGTGGYGDAVSGAVTQAIAKQPTSVQFVWANSPYTDNVSLPAPVETTIHAQVIGGSVTYPGYVVFERLDGDAWTLIGRGRAYYMGNGVVKGIVTLALPEGDYEVRAFYEGDSQYTPSAPKVMSLKVARVDAGLVNSSWTPVQSNHPIYLQVGAGPPVLGSNRIIPTGVTTIKENGVVILGDGNSWAQGEIGARPIGTYAFVAEYSGDDKLLPASITFTVEVVNDVVEATTNPLTIGTIYPYKDGYRDTVKAGGRRDEEASVTLMVKNGAGRTVRTATIASGSGAYQWVWNGRTSSGAQAAAGTYAVYTRFRDAAGMVKTVKQSVKVSSKRLHWSSASFTRRGSQTLKRSATWGAWAFTMPSATAYRRLKLTMTGYADVGYIPAAMGAQDARECAWSTVAPNCIRRHYRLGQVAGSTTTAYLNAHEHNGRYVRAYAWLGSNSWMRISKVRLSLEYAILR